MTSGMVIGIPWYRHEDWVRLKSVLSDAAKLHDTFAEWRIDAIDIERILRQEGHQVERVLIDPEAFPAWCLIRGRPADAAARAKFASESVRGRGLQ